MRDPIRELEEKVQRLELDRQRPYLELRHGDGERRVRIGLQDDGRWGVRVWDGAGALVVDDTTTV